MICYFFSLSLSLGLWRHNEALGKHVATDSENIVTALLIFWPPLDELAIIENRAIARFQPYHIFLLYSTQTYSF